MTWSQEEEQALIDNGAKTVCFVLPKWDVVMTRQKRPPVATGTNSHSCPQVLTRKGSTWTITSELPLDFHVHNPPDQVAWRRVENDAAPERSASAAAEDSPHTTHLEFILEQDVCHGRVGEANTQWTDPMTVPAISVCSQNYMQAAGHYINTDFTPLLSAPWPTFLDAAGSAGKRTAHQGCRCKRLACNAR